jgi:N-(2-amino-2-carboxyethyl)-L-glutamate synthase
MKHAEILKRTDGLLYNEMLADLNYSAGHLKIIRQLDQLIGNTRLHKLNYSSGNLYTKTECQNFFGSIKDRPAYYILKKAIEKNLINSSTTIIESTSGNFGIALAGICRALKLKFVPVIDPNISAEKENIMKLSRCEIIKVTERDETGGFLLNRIRKVKEYLQDHENSYTPNQYENPDNYMAYYHTLGQEIVNNFSRLDFAFISVSTGGTITGLSNKLKEKFKNIRIIGVDVKGSLIFDNKPAIRKISGMGASMRTSLLDKALIDEVIILSQQEIIAGCRELFFGHNLFLGGSSGAAYAAANRFLEKYKKRNINAIFISPDAGNSYLDTLYNDEWVINNIQ